MAKKKNAIDRFNKKIIIDEITGCWNWIACKNFDGYGSFRGPDAKLYRAHRWSYEYFIGPIENGLDVCHKCNNRACVNPDHLYIATAEENIEHAVKLDRMNHPIGASNNRAKLIEDDIIEIRKLYKTGSYTFAELGRIFGVTYVNIRYIIQNKTWSHIL